MKRNALHLLAVLVLLASLVLGNGPVAAGNNSSVDLPGANNQATGQEGDNPLVPSSVSLAGATHPIYLKSRTIQPEAEQAALDQLVPAGAERAHILVQLDFIPRQAAKDEFARQGLKLLDYLPDYAWIAAVDAGAAPGLLNLPGVVWAGGFQVNDKLDAAVRENRWSSFNTLADGRVAVYVMLHADEAIETGRGLAANHGGTVVSTAVGANLLVVELPPANILALAAEEAVQWIEPAAPILGPANDGIRTQIGVNTVQAAPYNLDGTGVDVLVYDSGNADAHTDFGGRLVSAGDDTIQEHSTHVAGTIGGSGANSAAMGGSPLQWRGMAPNVDLLSYGTGWTSGVIFYEDVGDIEADFAAAQNLGADISNASVGSNLYKNYLGDPNRCTWMGNYGASDVLIDQIVRGGNAVVGVGDKIIAVWAAGNERNSASSCSDTYNSIAPPGAAKNPIHVGAVNTNNDSMTTFSSWGPTDDGRIKPTVVSGGCQSTGDGGITSTDDDVENEIRPGEPRANDYTTMCGTSMSSPSVTGSVALMLQAYRQAYNTSGNFWPSSAKALLIQTATDLGNVGPDYQYGFGRVNIQLAVDLINRKGLVQTNVAHAGWKYYSVVVASSASPLRVSLAWDDRESTLNANPTLINNLDLELVSPGGAVWRPWILNPASPATNATRGSDSINNQEQVEVTSPEVGTWLVKVRGTNVPQGPQEFSLACEGCRALDVGVCTNTTSINAAADFLPMTEGPQVASAAPQPVEEPQVRTPGEAWQQALESGLGSAQSEQARQMAELEGARAAGAGALRALLDHLTGEALDLAVDELHELVKNEPPSVLPVAPAISLEEETQANLAAQRIADPSQDESAEGIPVGSAAPESNDTLAPAVDRTVGPGCTYATIAAAYAAASPGDRLRLAGNVTFAEHVTISKNLTIEGGYNGCTSASTAPTTIDGTASGTVMVINQGTVALSNLIITNGSYAGEGGGIRFGMSAAGALTLTNVEVHHNTATWGGGVWIGSDSSLTATGLNIHDNTATSYGGGLRLFGGRAALNNANIHHNSAPYGGGVYGSLESAVAPSLNLAASADIYSNTAGGAGQGGGLYLANGSATVTASSDIYSNAAVQGGGAFLVSSSLTVRGSSSEIMSNTTTGLGGGIYAISASSVQLYEGAEIYNNTSGSGGGGAYLDASYLTMYSGYIWYNSATGYGGGIAAYTGSIVSIGISNDYCTSTPCLRLENNTASSYGGGLYLNTGSASFNYAHVMNNAGTLGGGIYASGATVNSNATLIARNDATAGTGDGLRLISSSTFTGVNVTFANNDAAGAATGQAINLSTSIVTLSCSIIWNHDVSLSGAPQNVDYSDVQGGYAGTANLNVNPLFVNAGASDFHLQSGSPLLDRCPSGSTHDMDLQLRPILLTQPASPFDMGADEVSGTNRVGVDGTCSYPTIQQAVNAAPVGATIRVAAGVFFETVDVSKSLTVQGGYDATCATTAAGETRVEGVLQGGSVFDISGASTVTLRDLSVRWGTGIGAGIDVLDASLVTLNKAKIYNNHGTYGGGIYVAANGVVTIENDTDIYHNTAATAGGGVRVWGTFNGYETASDIESNCAPDGGGFSVNSGTVLLDNADVVYNQAAGATGKGGGIHVTNDGQVTLRNSVYIGETGSGPNTAYDGAGIYADASQVTLEGALTTICNNDATHFGGGIFVNNGSTLTSTGAQIGNPVNAECGGSAVTGGGIYASGSTVNFTGKIHNNRATTSGGGIYATASTVNLTGSTVGGTEANQPNKLTGAAGYFGPGIYLDTGSMATLDATTVSSNQWTTTTITYGGGLYLTGSTAVLQNNSRVENHATTSLTDGRGAGLYLNSSTVTLDHSVVTGNSAQVGGGIRVFNASVLNVRNGSSIDHNTSTQQGGGIAVGVNDASTPDVNIENAILQYNTVGTDGGAVYIDVGTLDFTGWWDLRWNHADGNGGGLAVAGTADADLNATAAGSYLAVNYAGANGGGIYLHNNDTVNLHATSGYMVAFNTNTTSGNGGGGFADAGGFFDVYGNLQMTSNQATGNGGLFYLSGGSRVWFDDYVATGAQIMVNQAANGGAIYADGSPRVECDGAVFGTGVNGNKATSGSGGAVYLNNSTFSADNCTFLMNQATVNGGAISAVNSTLTILSSFAAPDVRAAEAANPSDLLATACNPSGECSAFHDNLADSDTNNTGNGGALYLSGGSLTMTFTHLYRNQAVRGGAIYQTGAGAASTLENSLLYANRSTGDLGGGIRSEGGAFSANHVTIADSTQGAGFSSNNTGSLVTNSIAWGNANGGFFNTFSPSSSCNIDQSGFVGLNINPKFLGGGDYRLVTTSPAVDACTTGLPKDLNNLTRPIGAKYDMGAFEGGYSIFTHLPFVMR